MFVKIMSYPTKLSLLSELCFIQQNNDVKSHLGTETNSDLLSGIDIFKSNLFNLSRRFPIPCVTNTIRSCDPMCQIRKISKISSLFGTLGHKHSRRWDFRTFPNFPDRYLKRSILFYQHRYRGEIPDSLYRPV